MFQSRAFERPGPSVPRQTLAPRMAGRANQLRCLQKSRAACRSVEELPSRLKFLADCSQPYNVVPAVISAFPKTSSRLWQQLDTLSPSIQALQHHPDLHEPATPSQRGRPTWVGIGHFARQLASQEKSCSPVIPHRSTRLGVQAQRRDS